MSYRNDHDAALSRIDALEAELARARSDDGAVAARAELARLEAEIRRAREARAALLDEAKPRPKRGRAAKLFVAMTTLAVMFTWYALHGSQRAARAEMPEQPAYVPPPPTPPPVPAPTVPRSATRLVECAGELRRAIAERTASSQACIDQIRLASADPGLGDDIHALLVRWLDAEGAIHVSADDAAVDHRNSLAPEIRRLIIPSFTR